MTLQYTAVGIQNQSTMATSRDDYWRDLERLAKTIGFAVWQASLDLPVKIVAVSEGGIGGWCLGGGEEHVRIARDVVPEIPGKETEFLGDGDRARGQRDPRRLSRLGFSDLSTSTCTSTLTSFWSR